uniref:Ig-like domain-containing protein n=1 Tax=Mastacembelus armatus TaxID=205130 RepID=A0A3Q3N022_9TELE
LTDIHYFMITTLTVVGCGSRKVVGRTGQNVTLPCNYDVKANGNRSICWNRGDIPLNGCNNLLIATGSYKVTENNRVSSRYRLLGSVDEGDVSLTILNLTEEDAGRYGCRVDIPWWTDDKYHIDLVIDRGNPQTKQMWSNSERHKLPCPATSPSLFHQTGGFRCC